MVNLCAALCLAGCTATPLAFGDIPLRNPTVPIGAITRFEAARFDGDWTVAETAGGDWGLRGFTVAGGGTGWQEAERAGSLEPLAAGILRLTYTDDTTRDLWIVWIDPDHRTVAIGDPEGRFGLVAVRGAPRADQIVAAKQVLDFNGYRTATWEVGT